MSNTLLKLKRNISMPINFILKPIEACYVWYWYDTRRCWRVLVLNSQPQAREFTFTANVRWHKVRCVGITQDMAREWWQEVASGRHDRFLIMVLWVSHAIQTIKPLPDCDVNWRRDTRFLRSLRNSKWFTAVVTL